MTVGLSANCTGRRVASTPLTRRCASLSLSAVHTLLARCGHERVAQRAVRRQPPGRVDEVDPRQGDERRKVFEAFQR